MVEKRTNKDNQKIQTGEEDIKECSLYFFREKRSMLCTVLKFNLHQELASKQKKKRKGMT